MALSVCAGAACKSDLLLLCERFQAAYGRAAAGGARAPICLNAAAAELGVPRRRLYDIMNVLEAVEVRTHVRCLLVPPCSECGRTRHAAKCSTSASKSSHGRTATHACCDSEIYLRQRASFLPDPHSDALQIVARTGKLTYEWHGTAHLPALLTRLLAAEPAAERRPRRHGWAGRAAAPGFAGSSSPAGSEPVAGAGEGAVNPSSARSDITTPAATAADVSMLDGDGAAGSAGRGNACRLVQHSLWRLSILFVRLLLTSQVRSAHCWTVR